MGLVTVRCAICGSSAFKGVYPGTIVDLATEPSQYVGSSRVRAGYLPIVRCTQCGLMMTNPQDDAATLAAVYANHEDATYEVEYENRRRAALDHLGLVGRLCPKPGRVLDIGCATGAFVCVAQDAGWQATGLDASEWMVARGKTRCPKATFKVSSLENATFKAGAFEVITLWDVLEHVSSPLETLHRVHGWLIPNGCVYLSVPNSASVIARLMGKRWVLLLREHLWYFSPKTIARLLAQAGFDLVEARPKLVQFSVANILNRLGQYHGAVSTVVADLPRASILRRVSLRFPIGEMDVVGRAR